MADEIETKASMWSTMRLTGAPDRQSEDDTRTAFEKDYDRLLFSAPVRRMADKTQVFPLDKNDSVRTRLTHSHEVANLARSLGYKVVRKWPYLFEPEIRESVPVILALTGLAHDLGNPPFGHQGEKAMGAWFKRNEHLFNVQAEDDSLKDTRNEFIDFEGNAQTLRLLSRLQIGREKFGLNLTAGVLAACMKYTVPASRVADGNAATKKYGFFSSEADIVSKVFASTGLEFGRRHPLVWLMEACDDIAYSVLDVEDSVKKRIVSYHDVIACLSAHLSADGDESAETPAEGGEQVPNGGDPVVTKVVEQLKRDGESLDSTGLTPSEENEVSTQLFRTRTIGALIDAAASEFHDNFDAINAGTHTVALMDAGRGKVLAKTLQEFAKRHAFCHRTVLEIELKGYNAIQDLMDWFWLGISDRKKPNELGSKRNSAFSSYVYSLISENYRRIFERECGVGFDGQPLSIRYRELRLLTDMISGMTDTFAMEMHRHLKKLHREFESLA